MMVRRYVEDGDVERKRRRKGEIRDRTQTKEEEKR